MANYRLLRSNREIGPYSLEEIISLGLKPYDLIWVDGKSAAWRYPSEIAELKPYAPIVEEQPYDRFFKRPVPVQDENLFLRKKATSQQVETPVVEPEPVSTKATEKTHSPIVVVMPKKDNTRVTVIKPFIKTDVQETDLRVEKESLEEKSDITPVKPLVATEETISEPVVMETKMERSLEEIKDMYLKTLIDRKEKFNRRKRHLEWGKYVAAALFVGALGTLVFLTLTNKPPEAGQLAVTSPSGSNEQDTDKKDQPGLLPAVSLQAENTQDQTTLLEEPAVTNSVPDTKPKQSATKQSSPAEPAGQPVLFQEPQVQTPVEGTREKQTRERKDGAPRSSEELMRLVSVDANEYKRLSFGGIKDLQLTVSNKTSFVLDQVVVELNYLKPSELPLKTETITFRSVAPNGSMTIKIPDSNRGIKVSYKVKEVVSGELSDEWAKNK